MSPISVSLSSAPPRPFLHPHAPYLHIEVQVPKFHPLRKNGAGLAEGGDPDPSLHCELGFQELLRTAGPEWLLVHLDTQRLSLLLSGLRMTSYYRELYSPTEEKRLTSG